MKKRLLLASLLICATTSVFADDSFQWHGYYRAGLGMADDLSNINKNSNEVHSLGRYGLEYDDFVAASLSKRWTDAKGQWSQYNFSYNVFDYSDNYTNPTNYLGDLNHNGSIDSFELEDINTLDSCDNYVEMGGLTFLPKDSSIWVGKRRIASGIDLLDEDYKKFNGHGIGFSSKNFDINFFKELVAGDMGEYADVATIDATIKTKSLNIEGTITKSTTDTSSNTAYGNKKGDISTSILAEYKSEKFLGLLHGNTTYRAQLGKGVTADKLNMAVITDEKDTAYRFTADSSTMTKNWTVNTVVNYESSKDDSANITYSTLSVVGRGTYKLTDNISMIYEAALTNKSNIDFDGTASEDADGTAYKLVAGPAVQLDTMPWVRPIIRTTVTLIGGDKEVTNLDDTSELRLGAQFETYF